MTESYTLDKSICFRCYKTLFTNTLYHANIRFVKDVSSFFHPFSPFYCYEKTTKCPWQSNVKIATQINGSRSYGHTTKKSAGCRKGLILSERFFNDKTNSHRLFRWELVIWSSGKAAFSPIGSFISLRIFCVFCLSGWWEKRANWGVSVSSLCLF